MYAIPGAGLSEHQTIVQAAPRVPHGVVCLLSALRFHDLTTQSPFEIWMAIDGAGKLVRHGRQWILKVRTTSEKLALLLAMRKKCLALR